MQILPADTGMQLWTSNAERSPPIITLTTGDVAPALAAFFGRTLGCQASTANRLIEAWQTQHERWSRRDLSGLDRVYV